jgi:hypothetical protein
VKRLLPLLLCACTTFEDPDIVIDMRILAMAADIPDQVVEIDVSMGEPDPVDVLDQLVPATMCALVADPLFDRRLRYSMTLCQRCAEGCCEGTPSKVIATGVVDDPDTAVPAPQICGTVEPDGNLLGVVLPILEDDVFRGIGGIYYGVVLKVGGEDEDPALDLIGGKSLRINPKFPPELTANVNPTIDHFDAAKDGVDPMPMPMGRCVEQTEPLTLVPTQRVRITPIEPPDGSARETYVTPTLDGGSETFTESLTYQWMAGAGGFSSGSTGGPRDISGNPAPLFTDFRAPRADDLDGPTDIPLWIVQRDERLGAVWYETCVRVVP